MADYNESNVRTDIRRRAVKLAQARGISAEQMAQETGLPKSSCQPFTTTKRKYRRKWITVKTAEVLDIWLKCYEPESSDASEQQIDMFDKPKDWNEHLKHEAVILKLEHEVSLKDAEIHRLKAERDAREHGNAQIRDIRANLLAGQPEPANEVELLRYENTKLRELLRAVL